MPQLDALIDLEQPPAQNFLNTVPETSRLCEASFHLALDRHCARRRPLRVLNLTPGSGRCLFKWLSTRPEAEVSLHCLQPNAEAAALATVINRAFHDRVIFISSPLVKFKPAGTYDLIWACGVFDYFKDSIFRARLCRLTQALAPGGELIAGNLSRDTPRNLPGNSDTKLHRRTAEGLIRQALGCGLPLGVIRISTEPSGATLFLHINKPG